MEGVGIILVAALGTDEVTEPIGGEFGQALVAPGHRRIVFMAAFLTLHDGPHSKK